MPNWKKWESHFLGPFCVMHWVAAIHEIHVEILPSPRTMTNVDAIVLFFAVTRSALTIPRLAPPFFIEVLVYFKHPQKFPTQPTMMLSIPTILLSLLSVRRSVYAQDLSIRNGTSSEAMRQGSSEKLHLDVSLSRRHLRSSALKDGQDQRRTGAVYATLTSSVLGKSKHKGCSALFVSLLLEISALLTARFSCSHQFLHRSPKQGCGHCKSHDWPLWKSYLGS
jgi:hypothetical protein